MKIIILDPGHGGEDPGAVGKLDGASYKEADFTYDIAKRIWARIAPSYSAFISRKENETKSLNDRCLLAKRLKANFFLSIHINSAPVQEARGFEAYSVRTPLPEYAQYQKASKEARDIIIRYLAQNYPKWPNRGGKEANFQVIKYVPCPSVLVELGFISNPEDLKLLSQEKFRDSLAQTIAQALFEILPKIK